MQQLDCFEFRSTVVFGPFTYLTWLAIFIGLPIAVLVAWRGRIIFAHRRALFWVVLGAAFGGWAWDFTAMHFGFWTFDEGYLIGWGLFGLPLEEWLWITGTAGLFSIVTILLETRRPQTTEFRTDDPQRFVEQPSFVAIAWVSFSQLSLLLAAGLAFHALLWARNGPFLKSRFDVIAKVTGLAILWLLVSDPIGAAWQCWIYDPERVIGIWLLGLIPIEDVFGIAVVGSAAACATLVFGFSPRKWI